MKNETSVNEKQHDNKIDPTSQDDKGEATRPSQYLSLKKGPKISCSECSRIFGHQEALQRHWKREHEAKPSKNTFPCPHCRDLLKTRRYLNAHIRLVHGRDAEKKCVQCNASFTNTQKLSEHKRRAHSGGNIMKKKSNNAVGHWYVCEVCGFGTAYLGNLKRHTQKKHSNS